MGGWRDDDSRRGHDGRELPRGRRGEYRSEGRGDTDRPRDPEARSPEARGEFERDRDLDRRARAFDPERIARNPGYSPSGTFRGYRDAPRDERPSRYDDVEPQGHGPGVENMSPPSVGYGTSPSRWDDHELGHGATLGGGPTRAWSPLRPQTSPPRAPVGRGPRGYQRSDERIREDVCDRLMQGWMDAADVEVRVQGGEVTLTGTVRSRDEKRAIEDVAGAVLGVADVVNSLRLHRDDGVRREPSQLSGLDTGDERDLDS